MKKNVALSIVVVFVVSGIFISYLLLQGGLLSNLVVSDGSQAFQNAEYSVFVGGQEIGKITVAVSDSFDKADACAVAKAAFALEQSRVGAVKLNGEVGCTWVSPPAIVRLTVVDANGREAMKAIGEIAADAKAIKIDYV